jgi:hypothetical protein
MSLPRVPKMEQRAHKTQALEALTHLRPLLRARRNHKKYLQNGFFSGLLVVFKVVAVSSSQGDSLKPSAQFARGWPTMLLTASALQDLHSRKVPGHDVLRSVRGRVRMHARVKSLRALVGT